VTPFNDRSCLPLARTVIGTPIGDMVALASPEGLCALEFADSGQRRARLYTRLERWFPSHQMTDAETPVLVHARAWLGAYFEGTSADADGLSLDLRGAPFQLRVWAALQTIAPGRTTSYGALAKTVQSPNAARAVGAANGANPVAIIVPCHRAIGASGALVGYGGGLDRKTWLIDHERRWRADRLF
jgi:methylated-DNA-[protein]-cysteine S-methyltransferase